MKQITENSVNAFIANQEFKYKYKDYDQFTGSRVNDYAMRVVVSGNDTELKQWGNTIAYKNGLDTMFSFCGYPTVTTKERINGLLEKLGSEIRIITKNFQLYAVAQSGNKKPLLDDYYYSVNELNLMN